MSQQPLQLALEENAENLQSSTMTVVSSGVVAFIFFFPKRVVTLGI